MAEEQISKLLPTPRWEIPASNAGVQTGRDHHWHGLIRPLILWIKDGLMAIFLFLIGLGIKRELLVGELNSAKKAIFPFVAAIGDIAFPTLVFVLSNQDPETLVRWTIPLATDIAFSLSIMKLLGDQVPWNLKIFLTTFAIVDDLGRQ